MTAYLETLGGGLPSAVLAMVLSAAAFGGCGAALLRVCGIRPGAMTRPALWLTSMAAGFAVCAFDFALLFLCFGTGLTPCLLTLVHPLAGIGFLFAFRRDYFPRFSAGERLPWAILFLVIPILVLSIGCFQYPASWDECVYQLAVPKRWLADGAVRLYPDLPYSGFPLLPQFLYLPLMRFSGLGAVKLLVYGAAAGFAGSLVLLTMGGFRRNLTAACLFAASFLLAPITVHVLLSGYAEPLMAFLFGAGLLLCERKQEDGRESSAGTAFLQGILGGAMTAMKLTGFFFAAGLLLYELYRHPGRRMRRFFCFAAAAIVFALPFYLRPLLESGNPVYPYFGWIFGTPSLGVTRFHHLLGTANFSTPGTTTLLLLLPGLSFPSLSNMFDGAYGLQLILWICLAAAVPVLRPKRFRVLVSAPLLILFLTACWFLSSPQARFLMPVWAALALAVRQALPCLRERRRDLFLCAAVVLTLFSFPRQLPAAYWSNLKAMAGGADGKLDILYGRTGDSMLPAADVLRQIAGQGKCLLILEERTLYFPRECEIGTPFFQDKYFPGGKIPDADGLMAVLDANQFDCVYLRPPEKNPDYLPRFADLWVGNLVESLSILVKENKLTAHPMPGGAVLFSRTAAR